MNLSDDLILKVGEVETYAYFFQNSNKDYQTEYIHCIVLERLDDEAGSRPKKVIVNQIHNLEAYLSNPDAYDHFSARILNTDNITKLIGTER